MKTKKSIRKKKSFNKNPNFGRVKPSYKEVLIFFVIVFIVAFVILSILN